MLYPKQAGPGDQALSEAGKLGCVVAGHMQELLCCVRAITRLCLLSALADVLWNKKTE